MTPASARRRATVLASVAVTLAALGLYFVITSRHVPLPAQGFGPRGFAVSFALVFVVTGWIIATKRPENPIGWLFLAGAIAAGVQAVAENYATKAVTGEGSTAIPARLAAVGGDWIWMIGFGGILLTLCLFPDGRPPSPRWTRWMWAAGVLIVLDAVLYILSTRPQIYTTIVNPLGVADLFDVASAGIVGFLLALGLALASVVVRFRRARGDEREQIKWLVLALSLVAGSFALYVLSYVIGGTGSAGTVANMFEFLITLGVLAIPVSIGIGVLKYRLYDIDVVIRKTVVFAILVLLVMGLGAALVLVTAAVAGLQQRDKTLVGVAAFVVGVSTWPLYLLAQRIADLVVYRGRATPYEVLTSFSGHLGDTYATDDVLPRMAQVLATGTGAESATVWLEVGGVKMPVATWPFEAPAPDTLPPDAEDVRHQGEVLGALSVVQPASDPMTPAKATLVADMAAQAGLVLRNVRLIEELRSSRRRIVSAQDERAKQLERNIHDGVQQQFVALHVQLSLLASIVDPRPGKRRRRWPPSSKSAAGGALEDLRDLARGIYPPLLADKGLAAALEAQARKAAVPTTVDADGSAATTKRSRPPCTSARSRRSTTSRSTRAQHRNHRLATPTDTAFRGGRRRRGVRSQRDQLRNGTAGHGRPARRDRRRADIESAPGSGTTISGTVPV